VDFSGNKVGGSVEDAIVLFPDPMGATGSSLLEAINFYKREAKARKLISLHLVVSPEFIKKMKAEAPDLIVYAFRVDRGASSAKAKDAIPGEFLDEESGLTDIQYIVPGLGGLGELINNSYC
jgi:uracil phosphoribosyltransferase